MCEAVSGVGIIDVRVTRSCRLSDAFGSSFESDGSLLPSVVLFRGERYLVVSLIAAARGPNSCELPGSLRDIAASDCVRIALRSIGRALAIGETVTEYG